MDEAPPLPFLAQEIQPQEFISPGRPGLKDFPLPSGPGFLASCPGTQPGWADEASLQGSVDLRKG